MPEAWLQSYRRRSMDEQSTRIISTAAELAGVTAPANAATMCTVLIAMVKQYCRRDDIPPTLEAFVASMLAEQFKAALDDGVSAVKEGDTQVTFNPRVQRSFESYMPMLSAWRRYK